MIKPFISWTKEGDANSNNNCIKLVTMSIQLFYKNKSMIQSDEHLMEGLCNVIGKVVRDRNDGMAIRSKPLFTIMLIVFTI